MTTFVGIDPSITATGCAVWHDGEITVRTLKSDSKANWPTRWQQILTGVWMTVGPDYREHGPVMFIIEQPPAKFVGPAAALPNHGLYAIMIHTWWKLGMKYVDVQPTQLKKFATGKGAGPDASKEGVLLAIERRYGHMAAFHNNNESDAFALLAMGMHHYGRPMADLPAVHIERLHTITWPEWNH
jgi:Holliday junction resolvasome RuvABC endonuclease subunit